MAKATKPTWQVDTRTGKGVLRPYAKQIASILRSVPQRGLTAYYDAGRVVLRAAGRTVFGKSMVVKTLADPELAGISVSTLSMCRDLAKYWHATEVGGAAARGMSRRAVSVLLSLNVCAFQRAKYGLTGRQARLLRSATGRFIAAWPRDGSRDEVRSWYDKVAVWKRKHRPLLGNPRSRRRLHGAVQRLETAKKTVKATIDGAQALLAPPKRAAARRSGVRIAAELTRLRETLQSQVRARKGLA